MLLDRYDAILSDLDGVVYAGPLPIEGAPGALNRAQELGVPVVFVTNNASRSVDTVAEHLVSLGVRTGPKNVVSSAQVAAHLLKSHIQPGSRVLVTGTCALADCVESAGFVPVSSQKDTPAAVVQGFNPHIVWEELAEAAYTLADRNVVWVASNTDLTIPNERGIAPGNGALVNAVATATGRTPYVAGKPETEIFAVAAQKLGSNYPIVVGDRLDTDIRGGNRAAMATACVMTGIESYETVLAALPRERPTYILETLQDLFEKYPDISVETTATGTQATSRRVTALASGRRLSVAGCGDEKELWRVGCAAWWAEHPAIDAPMRPQEIDRDRFTPA